MPGGEGEQDGSEYERGRPAVTSYVAWADMIR